MSVAAWVATVLSACAPTPLAPIAAVPVPLTYRESSASSAGGQAARAGATAATGSPGAASPVGAADAGADAHVPLAQPADGWWRIFGDARLEAWVTQARAGNPGLAQAAARVDRAAAALGVQAALAQPQLEASAGAGRQVGALVNAAGSRGNLFSAGLGLSWDADLLKRLSRQQQSALHDLQAQQALHRQALLVLEAEVAQAYLAWRGLGAEQRALAAVLQADRRLVAMAGRQVRAGLAAETLHRSALAEQRADEAEAQQLARRRALLAHALIALAGGEPPAGDVLDDALPAPTRPARIPAEPVAGPAARSAVELAVEPFARSAADATADIATDAPAETAARTASWPEVPAGLPSAMLRRRPDVAAAEAALQAARLRLGLASDAWFPTLTLTAHAGLASGELGQWLRAAARHAGLGLLLNLPVFDGGRTEAERAAAQAVLAEATAAHRGQVVQALREVDDQLATLRTLTQEAEARAQGAALAADEARRARGQWQRGLVGEAEAWQTERSAQRQRRLWLQAHAARGEATVGLVRALGGGWAEPARVDAPQGRSHPGLAAPPALALAPAPAPPPAQAGAPPAAPPIHRASPAAAQALAKAASPGPIAAKARAGPERRGARVAQAMPDPRMP